MQSDKSKALIDSITDSINTLATMTDATAKSDLFKTWLACRIPVSSLLLQ